MIRKLLDWLKIPIRRQVKEKVRIRGVAIAVLTDVKTGAQRFFKTKNLVTNEGDKYYAQMGADETPTTDFTAGGLRLGTGSGTAGKTDTDVATFFAGTGKSLASGYPKTADDDTNNPHDGVVDCITWKYFYDTGEANDSEITECAIVDSTSSPTKALSHFFFETPFTKDSGKTLSVYCNHEFLGA